MKELHGHAVGVAAAPLEQCAAFVADVDRYPGWYPEVVKEARVLARDPRGLPSRAHAMLHVARGPLVKDFNLTLEVTADLGGTIKLARIPHDSSDGERFEVVWSLRRERAHTNIELRIDASLNVPRLVPLGGVGDSLAEGFLAAATRELGAPAAGAA
jgi:ribosome-associated toxin RatA of RatAB toxin-antitoxin module